MAECYLSDILGCTGSNKEMTNAGPERIKKIIESSKIRKDTLHVGLQSKLDDNRNLIINYHRDCVSTYTSSFHIKRHLKRVGSTRSSSEPPPRKRTRSDVHQFDFRQHCVFCGERCDMKPDSKHPDRWRQSFLCRTADRPGRQTFKEAILQACGDRKDDLARKVEIRLQGAVSDLHAADARYHDDCRKSFMSPRNVASISKEDSKLTDHAFEAVVSEIRSDVSHIWTSVEIHKSYAEYGGSNLSRSNLIRQLIEHFDGELVVFSSPGLANILLFRSKASELLRLVELEEEDKSIDIVAKQIVTETKELCIDKDVYDARIDKGIAKEQTSHTLLSLLSSMSDKLRDTLPAFLVGNIITGILKRPTTLQIALGIQAREKSQIECWHDFGVTCSYDEVLRFKASAANAAAEDVNSHVRAISDSRKGLIQSVADNFDANISSQNGLKSTHALALLLTQENKTPDTEPNRQTIRRIRKEEMKKEAVSDIDIKHYAGPKKPQMPAGEEERHVLPLKVLAEQVVLCRRAQDLDFEFFKNITKQSGTPEFGGFNTRLAREHGHSLKPLTTAMYTPLIDMVPSDPDTMMTAMHEAQRLTVKCGQAFTVFTADQQLYRVMINVMWVHPELFPDFFPRLGGMHTLMSFVGCVGVLMANSGLEEILKAAFGGVPRMLTGKNFPQNVRALRMICEVLLGKVVNDADSYDDLMNILEGKAVQSRTTKLWLDCLVKPVLIMLLFIRAEREAEWTLHLYAVASMMPYFFAAGHVNYARYGLYYLRSMQKLPGDVLARFRNGEHVMRHKSGLWNGLWSDMFIETTFMRYGHGPGGLIGITLSPSAQKRWALSLHTCSLMLKDLADTRDSSEESQHVCTHKEEAKARIESDASDRKKLHDKLDTCVDPLSPDEHPEGIINIVSGKLSPESVNVDKSIDIGKKQMDEYESSWPEGCNASLSNKVVTMACSKKNVKCGPGTVYDTQLIYSRVMGLASSRDIDLKDVFSHELAPVPTSMFDDSGDMRIATSKSILKKKLQVTQSARGTSKPEVIILDGCAILWCIHWPSNGTVQDFVDSFWSYVRQKLYKSDVYLVFDRYYEYSIKSGTRKSRINQKVGAGHKLRLQTPLPSQQTVLTVTENKVQLIDILCEQLQEKARSIPASESNFRHKLLITGSAEVPQEVHMGVSINRIDMQTSHEEADVIIPQQMVHAASEGTKVISVVCDDTDVFVLLLHYYQLKKLTCSLLMEGTSSERTVIDIAETSKKHALIVSQLLAAHAVSGCNTVAKLSGVGKATVVKQLEKGQKLQKVGDISADVQEVIDEATCFVAACYGKKTSGSMSDVRYDVWKTKTGSKTVKKTPQLRALPPTSECFSENVKRAHLQACIWNSAMEKDPPDLMPTHYGWTKDKNSKTLTPVAIPDDQPPAPMYVLQMIRYGCASDQPCATGRCGCYAAQLACTIFCNCHVTSNCQNRWTKDAAELSDEEASSDTDHDE